MVKHTLKILRCSHCKFLKYVKPFFNIMHERVKDASRTLSKILDGVFLWVFVKAFRCSLFWQKVPSLIFDRVLNTSLRLPRSRRPCVNIQLNLCTFCRWNINIFNLQITLFLIFHFSFNGNNRHRPGKTSQKVYSRIMKCLAVSRQSNDNWVTKNKCWTNTCSLIKKRLQHCEICEFFKNTCFEEHLRMTVCTLWNALKIFFTVSKVSTIDALTHFSSVLHFI